MEKIKTIGSTFMAASGIDPFTRQENTHKYQHLHELMEFVLELQNLVNNFNQVRGKNAGHSFWHRRYRYLNQLLKKIWPING